MVVDCICRCLNDDKVDDFNEARENLAIKLVSLFPLEPPTPFILIDVMLISLWLMYIEWIELSIDSSVDVYLFTAADMTV